MLVDPNPTHLNVVHVFLTRDWHVFIAGQMWVGYWSRQIFPPSFTQDKTIGIQTTAKPKGHV